MEARFWIILCTLTYTCAFYVPIKRWKSEGRSFIRTGKQTSEEDFRRRIVTANESYPRVNYPAPVINDPAVVINDSKPPTISIKSKVKSKSVNKQNFFIKYPEYVKKKFFSKSPKLSTHLQSTKVPELNTKKQNSYSKSPSFTTKSPKFETTKQKPKLVTNKPFTAKDITLTTPEAQTTEPKSPTKVPETPTKVPETPTKVPETPTKVPETPTKVPETPTPTNIVVNKLKVLDIGLYVTSDLKDDFYRKFEVEDLPGADVFRSTLLTNYLKGTNEIFQDPSIKDAAIRIVFTKFTIVPETTWQSWEDGLRSFCDYQSNATDVDISVLIVKKDGEAAKHMGITSFGQMYTDGYCWTKWRCGLIQENHVLYSASKRLIAHEIGHGLGLIDQGRRLDRKLLRSQFAKNLASEGKSPYDDLTCRGDQVGLMAATGDKWLDCSVRALRKILSSDRSECLDEKVSETVLVPDGTFIGMTRYTDREDMCRLYIESNQFRSGTIVEYDEKANQPLCKFGVEECRGLLEIEGGRQRLTVMDGQNFPTGVRCYKYIYDHFCYDGECLLHAEIMDKTRQFLYHE